MVLEYNVTGPDRKRLVQAIAEILGRDFRYMGTPTFTYKVGGFLVSKDGGVIPTDASGIGDLRPLAESLLERGFTPERMPGGATEAAVRRDNGGTAAEVPVAGDTNETPHEANVARDSGDLNACPFADLNPERTSPLLRFPRENVPDAALENLRKLVDSKAALIRKALGADRLDIEATEAAVFLPWFDTLPEPDVISAATSFADRLVDFARTHKRVTAKEREVENEKYAFRCFLLRLGFIGPEYKAVRKTLLRNLTGSAAFKNGDTRNRRVAESSQAADGT